MDREEGRISFYLYKNQSLFSLLQALKNALSNLEGFFNGRAGGNKERLDRWLLRGLLSIGQAG
jgi:hypothetical protein